MGVTLLLFFLEIEALGLFHLMQIDPLCHHGMLPHLHFQTLRVPLLREMYIPISRILPAVFFILLLIGVHPFLIDLFTSFFLQNLISLQIDLYESMKIKDPNLGKLFEYFNIIENGNSIET